MSTKRPSSFALLYDIAKEKEQAAKKEKEQAAKVDHKIDHAQDQSDHRSDQIDQSTVIKPPIIETLSNTPSTVNPVHNELGPVNPAQAEPSPQRTPSTVNKAHNEPRSERTRFRLTEVGGYRVANIIDDEIMPTLTTNEQVILRRLYRLSYGFNRQTTDSVSVSKLAEKCNVGESTIKRSLKVLEDRGLIMVHLDDSSHPKGGNRYSVLTGFIENPVQAEPSPQRTRSTVNHIKDHDDLKQHDHHQSETMMIYQSITGNNWSKADLLAYQKIKHLSIETIEQGVRIATTRAASRPGSLAYFVKEILSLANPTPASRSQRKRDLVAIIARVRTAHTGQAGYSMADFSADVKELCAREGVIFDHELFNELVQ